MDQRGGVDRLLSPGVDLSSRRVRPAYLACVRCLRYVHVRGSTPRYYFRQELPVSAPRTSNRCRNRIGRNLAVQKCPGRRKVHFIPSGFLIEDIDVEVECSDVPEQTKGADLLTEAHTISRSSVTVGIEQ